MAHKIEASDIVGSAEGKEWHGLAVPVKDALLKLTYTLTKVPAELQSHAHPHLPVTPFKSKRAFFLVASDTGKPIAGGVTVGPDYTPLQLLEDRLPLCEAIIAAIPGASLSTVGTVGDRSDFVATIALPKSCGTKQDPERPFIGVFGNNTGARQDEVGAIMTRMVCDNTRQMALAELNSSKHRYSIRKLKSGPDRMRAAAHIAQLVMPAIETAEATMHRLLSKTLDLKGGHLAAYYETVRPYPKPPVHGPDASLNKLADTAFERAHTRVENIRKCWFDNFQEELTALTCNPNLWLAFNSVSKWAQHQFKPKGMESNPSARWYSNNIPGGMGLDTTNLALTSALTLASK